MAIEALTSGVVAVTSGATDGPKVAQSPKTAAPVEKMAAPRPVQPESNGAVRAAAKQIDSYLRSTGRQLEFRVDDATGRTVVTVRMSATGEVIRQIPNDEVLELARHIDSGSHALLDLMV